MSWGFNTKPDPETCIHAKTVTVSTGDLERAVCETCGHVGVQFMTGLTGTINRTSFARPADSMNGTGFAQAAIETELAEAATDTRYGFMVGAGAR